MEDFAEKLREALSAAGLSADELACVEGGRLKVVAVASDLAGAIADMQGTAREHVVMVRVDDASLESLDRWVTAGIAKSRSEAAALFIREGLAVRADELARLKPVIAEYEQVRSRLDREMERIVGARPSDRKRS